MDDLRRLINGFQASQVIHVAATLGIADLLADEPRASQDLAEATGCDPEALYRLLRALAALGVLDERDGRLFALAPLGERLRTDAPGSLHAWAAFVGRDVQWRAWGALADSVRTGENAFRLVHGTDVWQFRAGRPDETAAFDAAMLSLTGSVNAQLLEAYDFGRFSTIVDVGGGRGALVAALRDAYPSSSFVLFDQPHVLDGVDLGDRVRVVAGSFFDEVPPGGDAYILKSIIHDWEDDDSVAILRTCRQAFDGDGSLLLVERDLGVPNEAPEAKLSDLNMLVNPGGRERTLDEYGALFEASGFTLVGATPTASGFQVIEAAPV